MFVFLPQDRSNFVCTKCKQVSILEEKVQGLEKQVSTLRCIRENEDFLDRCQDMFLRAQHSEESEQVVQWGQKDGEENWQHVTSRKRKRSVHVPAMQIQESQTLQDIVEQPADTSAISILKNHYPKITVTLKKMFPASGERKSPEKKMEAQFNLLNEKLGSVQKHLEVQLQNPLLVLEAQIIQLRNQLSSIDEKVSQEGEKKLKTIECMRFANRDELKVQEWRYLPEKKEISHLEKKLEQLMNTGKRGQIRLHLHQSYTSPLCL
nr:uncharacterized protein LOC101937062 isoform X3 [Chrysemys picta bellii]